MGLATIRCGEEMRRLYAVPVLVIMLATCLWLLATPVSSVSVAQEEAVAQEEGLDFDPERAERRLDEIERLIDQAKSDDNDVLAAELRREGERLIDQLEVFERSQRDDEDDDEDDDEEWDEEMEHLEREARRLEIQRSELEIGRMNIELGFVQQESAMRLAKLSGDPYAMKVYALTELVWHEEPEVAVDVLTDLLRETDNEAMASVIRLHLASLYRESDQPHRARQELRRLILGEQ